MGRGIFYRLRHICRYKTLLKFNPVIAREATATKQSRKISAKNLYTIVPPSWIYFLYRACNTIRSFKFTFYCSQTQPCLKLRRQGLKHTRFICSLKPSKIAYTNGIKNIFKKVPSAYSIKIKLITSTFLIFVIKC